MKTPKRWQIFLLIPAVYVAAGCSDRKKAKTSPPPQIHITLPAPAGFNEKTTLLAAAGPGDPFPAADAYWDVSPNGQFAAYSDWADTGGRIFVIGGRKIGP